MAQIKIPLRIPPTPKTLWYMQLLFDGCGFTYNSRNIYLTDFVKRKIEFLDQLSVAEGHEVIEKLKVLRENKK